MDKPTKCPECKSDNTYVDDGPYLDGFDEMYLTRCCDDCGAEWREEYSITLADLEVNEHGNKYQENAICR